MTPPEASHNTFIYIYIYIAGTQQITMTGLESSEASIEMNDAFIICIVDTNINLILDIYFLFWNSIFVPRYIRS